MDNPSAPTLFDHFVSTAERVGIPVVTAASGAYTLYITPTSNIAILPWLGAALILAALATYVWLTARTTVRIKSPPEPVSQELTETLAWMREEISAQNRWARSAPPPHDPG